MNVMTGGISALQSSRVFSAGASFPFTFRIWQNYASVCCRGEIGHVHFGFRAPLGMSAAVVPEKSQRELHTFIVMEIDPRVALLRNLSSGGLT